MNGLLWAFIQLVVLKLLTILSLWMIPCFWEGLLSKWHEFLQKSCIIFCIISGALINNRKSAMYGWNVDQSTIANISQILGFEGFASWDKVKYLGLPLTLGKTILFSGWNLLAR